MRGTPPAWRTRAGLAVLLAALAFAAHAPALEGGFLDFDDDDYVTENPFVRDGLGWRELRWALTTGHAANWHPLTWLAHQLDVELVGLDPRGHHASSIVVHTLNVLVLFYWLAAITGRAGASAWVAALFAVHPLRVESVAWIAERKDLLAALFGLVSLACYCAWARRGGSIRYALAWTALALGLAAKPTLVGLPLVFLLLDYWPLDRLRGTGARLSPRLVEKLPFVALSAASCVVTLLVQARGGAVGSTDFVPLGARAANGAVSYVRYVSKTVWPRDLAVLYPHPVLPGGRPWPAWEVAAALACLVIATAAVCIAARRRPWLPVGWFWFTALLGPTIGLVQVGVQAMADRYTYLPSIGLALLVVWTIEDGARRRGPRIAWCAAGVVALASLTLAARAQARHWRDPVALYEHAIAVTGGSAVHFNNLGAALEAAGRRDEAASRYRRALAIDPGSPGAHQNLARVLLEQGDAHGALEHARAAVALRPDWPEALLSAGRALALAGRPAAAEAAFQRALALRPGDAATYFNLGLARAAAGNTAQAAEAYREALERDPGYAPAHTNLANLYFAAGDPAAAELHYRVALESDPRQAEAWHGLGSALARSGRLPEALAGFRRASELRPAWPAPLLAEAWLLATSTDAALRDGARAVQLADRAIAAGTPDAQSLDVRAAALAEAGRHSEAVATAARAADLAERGGQVALAARIRERAARYRSAESHREPERSHSSAM